MVAERGLLLPQERIPEKICEQIVDVHVSQDVGQVFEAPKISSQDRNLQCKVGRILDVLLLEKAERLVEVPETVSQDRLQQRTVEEIIDAPVPQAEEELTEVFRVFSQDRTQERTVKQINPATALAEMIVVVPVIQTQGKTQQGMNTHAQHVVNTVEVEKPKITELTVQRKKPIIQEKINRVTKHVKIPEQAWVRWRQSYQGDNCDRAGLAEPTQAVIGLRMAEAQPTNPDDKKHMLLKSGEVKWCWKCSSLFIGHPSPISDAEWDQWYQDHSNLFFCLRDLSSS